MCRQRRPGSLLPRALLIVLAVMIGSPLPAASQTASVPGAAALAAMAPGQGAAPASPAARPGAAADELQNLVTTLQNDQARARLIEQLQALIAAQKQAAAVAPPSVASTAQGIVESLAAQFQTIGAQMSAIIGIARAAPKAFDWIAAQAASPAARSEWLDAAWRLAAAFAAAAAAAFLAGRLLRSARGRVGHGRARDFGRWLAQFVILLILALLPIAIFAAIATVMLAVLGPAWPARPVAAVAVGAIFRAQALLAAAWTILMSGAYPYFLRLDAETRAYLYIWGRRFVLWAVYGFALAKIATVLAAPDAVVDSILRLAAIVLAGLAIVFVLQNRAAVADFLRDGQKTRHGVFPTIRFALADTWHILVIVYLLGAFGSYLVDLHGGVGFVLRATVISAAALIGAVLVTRLIRHVSRRGFELTAETRRRYPGLEVRVNRYIPALTFLISALVYVVAIVMLLEGWGVAVVGWLTAEVVERMVGDLVSIVIVVVIAIAAWELVRAAIERALGGGSAGRQAQVSARLRTLLPLARSTVLIAIVTMAGIIVLSQLGVNIAPLLAGAGIIGIAVGLGSQQLVRDVINGLFILIENTVAIGDYVDVGGGHAGNVEELSIRSMRLRDASGAVHIIPFSAVSAITNVNRGLGNAAVNVGLAPGQDIDRAARLLAEVAAEMRRDPAFAPQMLSDFQYWGVDKVDASTVTLVGQIVCTDAGRWPVQREFNRRVMLRFAQEGIAFAVPLQGVIVREPDRAPELRRGDAPQITPFRAPR